MSTIDSDPTMTSSGSRDPVSGNLLANGVLQFMHYVFPIVTLPFVGHVVGSESFGVINYFSVLVGYFTLFVLYGFDFSGTRAVAQMGEDAQALGRYFNKVQSAKLLLLLMAGLLYAILVPLLPEGPNHEKIAWSTFGVTAGWALMPNWFVQGMRRMRALVWINVIPKVIFILVVFFIISGPKEAFIYPLSISLSSIIVAILSVIWVHRAFKIPVRISWDMNTWRLLKQERWIFLSGLINNTNQTFNVLILGFFVAFDSVGHFTLGWRLMNVTQVLVMSPIMQSLFPFIGEEIKNHMERGLMHLNRAVPFILSAVAFSTLGMLVVGPWVIVNWFGAEYVPAIPILQALLIVPFVTSSSHILGNIVLLNLNQDKKVFRVIASTAVVSVFLNIGLIAWRGLDGAIYALIGAEVFALISYAFLLNRLGISFLRPHQWVPKKLILPVAIPHDLEHVNNPLITLVIPTYKRIEVWPNLLRSLTVQTKMPDVIVVVDQSTDALHHELKRLCTEMLPHVTWNFIQLATPNRCQAKDLGIHSAAEGIVVVIDDDLWLPKDFLEYYHTYLSQSPKQVLTTRIIELDRPLLRTKKVQRYTWYGHFYNNNYSLKPADSLISVTGACFGFVMSSDVRHIHFEPAFIGTGIMEEPDLSWQLLLAGRTIVYKPEVTVVHFPQRDGNDAAKKVNAVHWYADSFYNFGQYHAKHHLGILHWLRKPYLYVLAANVVFTRGYSGGFWQKLKKTHWMLIRYQSGYVDYR
jgi:O-antigen/teichoic acid export membrane protein/glycosyltransferase involved in cell wall biosynthesis